MFNEKYLTFKYPSLNSILNHEPEVDDDSHKWHEIKTNRTEQTSPCLVNVPKHVDVPRCSLQWICVSEVSDLQLQTVALKHFVFL